jgi:integrase
MAKANQFTIPQIKSSGDKWFVWFRYREPNGKMKLFIKKGGVNYQTLDKKERLAQLQALRKALLYKLEVQGWNPITNTYPLKSSEDLEIEELQRMGFNAALDFALSKCDLAKKTKQGYSGTVNFFKDAAVALEIAFKPIVSIKRLHIKALLENIKESRSWSNKAYNKNLGYIASVIDRLVQWEILEINPAHKIKPLKVDESEKYVSLSDDEKKKILEHLEKNHFRFFVYLMIVYHTGIRPKEILSLQIRDLNLEKSTIKIIPERQRENAKNNKIRIVPLNQHLIELLDKLDLKTSPKEYYIFGSPFESGMGNKGSTKTGRGSLHPDYFKPSPTPIKRDTVTKLWNRLVIKGLGIEKYQYALKHTGADDKILAGINIDSLRELYGHSSKFMTEKYARKIKEVYRKEIIELSPKF